MTAKKTAGRVTPARRRPSPAATEATATPGPKKVRWHGFTVEIPGSLDQWPWPAFKLILDGEPAPQATMVMLGDKLDRVVDQFTAKYGNPPTANQVGELLASCFAVYNDLGDQGE